MTKLHIDFETRSMADLPECGVDVYSMHPSTDVWCMAYAFDDEPVQLWKPGYDISRVLEHVASGGIVVAHNAVFELLIWNNVLRPRLEWPELRVEQARCTMAMAYAMRLPGSLERAAAIVGLEHQKDAAGHRVMMQLCRPRKVSEDGAPVWWDSQEKLDRLYAYCMQDIATERELEKRLRPLSDSEQYLWELDYKINRRGIKVDTATVEKAIALVESEKARLDEEMRRVTNGAVPSCSVVKQLSDWIKYRGVELPGVAKADVIDALSREDMPEDVKLALRFRQEAAKTSTAKLQKMIACAGSDSRVRGAHQYHGAGTGRWAGRLLQTQNLKTPKLQHDQIEDVIQLIHAGKRDEIDMLYAAPMDAVSDCIRAMILAEEGNTLVCADLANIEGRVLAWLAGEEWKLQAFREYDAGTGPDLYILAASRMYNCSLEDAKEHRKVGKVAELALGYQGGAGAFQTMARNFGVSVSDERADEIKTAWRTASPKIVEYWKALETAAIKAVRNPGEVFAAFTVRFVKKGSFLWCQLPSGRCLCYPYPEIREKETPWGSMQEQVTYLGEQTVQGRTTKNLVRIDLYGGKYAENVTQAVARDILANALVTLERAGYQIVMHVHDEAVAEVPEDFGKVYQFEQLMCDLPDWADGLPVAAEGWSGQRYRK